MNQSEVWWQREFHSEYLYPMQRGNEKLLTFLKGQNFLSEVSWYYGWTSEVDKEWLGY